MHIVIRADGGPEIGYGHLVRSGALAEEMLDRGHAVTIATTTPQHARKSFPNAADGVDLPARDDPTPFVSWIETTGPDVAFTDAYPINTAYQRAVRERLPLAVLQDDACHAVCADLFVNGNLYAADLEYEFLGPKPEVCLGPRYVLLRSVIRDRLNEEPPWREPPERAIVTMGASDIAELTPTVVRAFDGLNLRVDAIVGPGFSKTQEQEVKTAADDVSADVRVARDPDNLEERMFQADFAVTTASSTTYELLALGTPIVSVPVADNQKLIAGVLRQRDAATVLERDTDIDSLQRAIKKYFSDSDLREERQELGRELIDGKGTERIANEVDYIIET